MTLRLIEVVIPRGYHEEVVGMLKEDRILEILDMGLGNDLTLFKILLTTEDSENILDRLEKRFSHLDGFRIFILPVQASIPRIDELSDDNSLKSQNSNELIAAERISREELYSNVLSVSKPTKIYFIMVMFRHWWPVLVS